MKKILACCLILVMIIFMFVGTGCIACGNHAIGFGNHTFGHIHFTDYQIGHCATVESWYESDMGIEINTTEYGSMFLSEGSYILFKNDTNCPYCSE